MDKDIENQVLLHNLHRISSPVITDEEHSKVLIDIITHHSNLIKELQAKLDSLSDATRRD